ncbi:hypothetical protein ID850_04240 [Xenorhabdus sp. Flor]|uniref:hypothetical protein n=1 Tax=Xenorhabdus cabanillasii TaxID=351673 RepID=UPI0019929D22|nr:hypothetical protein [Xenorhabdus sp. Flor]MBD2813989.1 hypothetical protein [Xenorhabdus sp. Flor]
MNKVASSNSGVIETVTIIRLETAPEIYANNNVKVTFKDRLGNINDKFYLAYPDKNIEGIGLYNTLLSALVQSIEVTLKTTGYVEEHGYGFISGVIIDAI